MFFSLTLDKLPDPANNEHNFLNLTSASQRLWLRDVTYFDIFA